MNRPADITAENGKLYIEFKTNATISADGFYAEYSIGEYTPSYKIEFEPFFTAA